MSNNSEEQITQNVLNSMAQAPDPRLQAVMTSLIHHLHDFIREVEPTQEEWMSGIQFLTRTGQMCDDKRQEFILFSDITGVTTTLYICPSTFLMYRFLSALRI